MTPLKAGAIIGANLIRLSELPRLKSYPWRAAAVDRESQRCRGKRLRPPCLERRARHQCLRLLPRGAFFMGGNAHAPRAWKGGMGNLFKNKLTFTFILLGLVLLLFIFVPLFKMTVSSDPKVLLDTLLDEQVTGSIWLTVYTALIATVLGLIFGVPLAYLLARLSFPGKRLIEGLIDVPIVVPHTAAGIALLFVFGQRFLVGKAFHTIGIDFVGALPGIVIAMLFVSVPFLVDSAKEGFKGIDPRLEKVARSLGASPTQTFFRVSLPLAWRSILSGSVMMWARGISEFGAVLILTYHPMIAPILIYERFESFGLDYSRPAAVLLILVCLIAFIALRYIAQRGEKAWSR